MRHIIRCTNDDCSIKKQCARFTDIPEERLEAMYFEALANYPCKYFVAKEITEDK